MSKLLYDKTTGAVAMMIITNDASIEENVARLNASQNQAILDAPDIHSVSGVVIDVSKPAHWIKKNPLN